MRTDRFFFQPNHQMPHHPYHQTNFPPHPPMNQQPYPSPHPNTPFHQGNWQPPYQGQGMQGMPGMGTGQQPLTKGMIGYFQNEEGKFDFEKVMNTAGQISNTYQQVSPLVKGIGSFFKGS